MELSSLPLDRRAIGSKWILIVKRDAQDNFEKFKARLIVQGFGQEFGFDYNETYAPVVRMDNVRLMFAISAYHAAGGLKHDMSISKTLSRMAGQIIAFISSNLLDLLIGDFLDMFSFSSNRSMA